MHEEVCYSLFCFVPPQATTAPKIFGFAEFLAAMALLVVLFTIIDTRFKFRLAVTPGAIYPVTFGLVVVIGLGTLFSELWLAEGWWVPRTALTRSMLQGIFALLFLVAFLEWMYYAFLRPPSFGRRNARRFAETLYAVIVKGDDSELPVIADELRRSAATLV